MWDWETAREGLPLILHGFGITLLATVLGSLLAVTLGLGIAVLRRTPSRWVTLPLRAAVEFVRSTPVMIQLFAVWVLVPGLDPLVIGIAVLGVHYATYTSEVYRAGIEAVPRGSGRRRSRCPCRGRAPGPPWCCRRRCGRSCRPSATT